MAMLDRLLGSAYCALLGYFVSKALDLPWWRSGWDWSAVGDGADFTLVSFLAAWCLSSPRRRP